MNVKKTLFYFTYWVAAILFFVWYLFPAEEAASYLSQRIEAASRDVRVAIDRVSPGFPIAVALEGIDVTLAGDVPVQSALLRLKPDYVSLARFQPGVRFFSRSYGGEIKGEATLTSRKEKHYAVKGRADGLSVGALSELAAPYLPEGYAFSGRVDVVGRYAREKGESGSARVLMEGFQVKLEKPFFTIEEVTFDRVEAELELKGKNARIKSMKIDGREVDGNLTGTVRIRTPLSRSSLNLSGNLKPDVVFMREFGKKVPLGLLTGGKKQKKGGFQFKVRGTIGKPSFSLN